MSKAMTPEKHEPDFEPETDLSPLEVLAEERLAALLEKDWQRYRMLGERMLLVIDERRALTQKGQFDDNYRF